MTGSAKGNAARSPSECFSVYGTREEWLAARHYGIGASDAAVVLGISPWKSNEALWEEKLGFAVPEDIGDKPYVRYGNDAEPLLREFFLLDHPEYEGSFTPYKVFRHPDKPFITCTPDGELLEGSTGRRGGLEIKTTEIRSASGWDRWKDRVPDEYYAQVCHQMLASGWEFVELLAQIKYTTVDGDDRKETRHYLFERADAQEDIDLLEREEIKFWEDVVGNRRPGRKILLPAGPRLKL